MTGQHFKEIIETLCKTYKVKKTVISRYIGISKVTLNKYEKFGVPISHKAKVMKSVREFAIEKIHPM